jgi:hypothetical protein
MTAAPIAELLMRYLQDTDAGWSCGAFGAIAEFARSPDEPVRLEQENGIAAFTARGAIRIAADPALVAVKRDTLSAIRAGAAVPEPEAREGRMVAEVAMRQAAWHDRSALTDHVDGRA